MSTRKQAKTKLQSAAKQNDFYAQQVYQVAQSYETLHPDIAVPLYEAIELIKIANEVIINTEGII